MDERGYDLLPLSPWMCCINTVILINLIPHAFSNIRSIPVLSDTLSGFKPWSHLLLYVHPLLTLHLYCVCELSKDMGSPLQSFSPSCYASLSNIIHTFILLFTLLSFYQSFHPSPHSSFHPSMLLFLIFCIYSSFILYPSINSFILRTIPPSILLSHRILPVWEMKDVLKLDIFGSVSKLKYFV